MQLLCIGNKNCRRPIISTELPSSLCWNFASIGNTNIPFAAKAEGPTDRSFWETMNLRKCSARTQMHTKRETNKSRSAKLIEYVDVWHTKCGRTVTTSTTAAALLPMLFLSTISKYIFRRRMHTTNRTITSAKQNRKQI